jgi:hypothetical protein
VFGQRLVRERSRPASGYPALCGARVPSTSNFISKSEMITQRGYPGGKEEATQVYFYSTSRPPTMWVPGTRPTKIGL